MAAREKKPLQLESVPKVSESTGPLVKVEIIDLIGVDNFLCILPYLVDLVNYLKIDIIWNSCFEKFKFVNQARLLIYSKYLICWHGRIQYFKTNSRSSSFSQWWRMMRNENRKYKNYIYLLLSFIIF